jgi:NTP pyrophosphatase (non-canonical NTP hydrolase)
MSSSQPSLAVGLQETAQAGLHAVQQSFHAYQSAHFPERSPEFFCLELCGEAGELANLEKKRWKGKTIDDAHIADEAADVCIALMNYANARGIDLGAAVGSKLARIEAKRAECERRGEIY